MPGQTSHSTSYGFTLAELLVVIAIIGILFTIVFPSLNTITGQSKLDGAANAVHTAATLAREYAITHNQPTYIVFNEGQTDSNLAFRAYAVFTINIHTNVIPVPPAAGFFIRDWDILPSGIVFDDQSDADKNLFNVNYAAGWNGALSEHNELKIQGNTYVVAGFTPKGRMSTEQYWTRRLLLAEKHYNPNGGRQGKEIRFDLNGRSKIIDLTYDENGAPQEILQ